MPVDADVLVVGGSVAAARCVEALRHSGFAGSVRLVSDEAEAPYDRPPLSKQFLAGDWELGRIRLLSVERAAELDVALSLGTAAAHLDTDAHRVTLADGQVVSYGSVILATGASARRSPWGEPPGLHTVRSLDDSARLRDELQPGRAVVVIGGGWIGAEIAATARARGCAVTVVDVAANPYARALGDELGRLVCAIHDRHGVAARFMTGVAGVRSGAAGLTVDLTDGSSLEAGVVVVGIGAVPNTDWLTGSGVIVDDGVVCDEYGRACGVADVWAIGDVARWGARRHEHWTSAVEQARAVAHNIATSDLVRSASDGYVWSDQYSWKIQLAGDTGSHVDCELVVDDAARPRLAALYRDSQARLVGVATVNWPKAFIRARRSIGTAEAFEHPAALRTPTTVPV